MKKSKIAAAIGNFDGVHRGHLFLIEQVIAFAHELGAEPGVVVFDPHPRRHFRPDDPPFLLTTPSTRANLIRAAGAAHVLTIEFNAATASMSAKDFVNRVLLDQFGLVGVMTGSEFRFGAGRSGDIGVLAEFCEHRGAVARVGKLLIDDPQQEKVSSSGVREAIHHGEMAIATKLLGRPWTISGFVTSGQKLGRQIGFPTANLVLGELIEPRRGVYAVDVVIGATSEQSREEVGDTGPTALRVPTESERGSRSSSRRVSLADNRIHISARRSGGVEVRKGIANFGRRPTVGAPGPLLEVHIFDFEGDLYGEEITVSFKSFIRDEIKFENIDALKVQIHQDSLKARHL
ncbi:MAG: bifunctional riboflavin kinase/FMN adenylyltransferase [Pseudomonadota bacterium]